MNLSFRERTRPIRRRVAKRIFAFPENWDHAAAQNYEIEHARQTIREHFPRVLREWRERPPEALSFEVGDQWFTGNAGLFAQFSAGIRDRQCLEIGSGPFGHLAPCRALRHRTIIEPLGKRYRDIQMAEFGETFFTPDIVLHTTPAETKITALVGAVDGLVVCRNSLDHCDDALMVLENVASYAARGCWFFLWTDIWHRELDQGHRNITRSHAAMRAILSGFGFDIIQEGAAIRDLADYLEFGCIARRR